MTALKPRNLYLLVFSEEPDKFDVWTEQDIYEQSRKIIETYEKRRDL